MNPQFNPAPGFQAPDAPAGVSGSDFVAPALVVSQQRANIPELQTASQQQPPVYSPAVQDENAGDDKAIEEEWVSKAKSIVTQTQSDPYREADALSRLKADYLISRHNKQLKVKDTHA